MAAENTLIVLDPEDVTVRRVGAVEFVDREERLTFTFTASDIDEDIGDLEVVLALKPEPSIVFVLGVLQAFGFSEDDRDYIEERWKREFR